MKFLFWLIYILMVAFDVFVTFTTNEKFMFDYLYIVPLLVAFYCGYVKNKK